MRYIPSVILFYIWLVFGRADPGGVLDSFPIVRWFTYILIPLALLTGIVCIAARGKYKKTILDGPIVLLTFFMTLSTYLNGAPWANLFYGIAVYLRYPLLFILFCNFPQSTSRGRGFMRILWVIVILLTFEAVFDFVFFGMHHDATFFTLGMNWGTTNAGIFFIAIISLLTAQALLKGERFYHTLLFSLIILAVSIASIRTTLIFSLPIIIIVYAIHKRWLTSSGLTGIAIVFTSLIFFATLMNWHALLSASPVLLRFNPGYRLDFIREVLLHVADSGELLLGAGPRSMNPGAAGSTGVVYQHFLDNSRWVLNLGSNQYVEGLSELGLAGMLVYWFMLYRVLRMAWLNWVAIQRGYFFPMWLRVANLGFFGIWIFYAGFGLISNDLWRMDASSLIFWFLAAVITVAYRNHRMICGSIHPAHDSLPPVSVM